MLTKAVKSISTYNSNKKLILYVYDRKTNKRGKPNKTGYGEKLANVQLLRSYLGMAFLWKDRDHVKLKRNKILIGIKGKPKYLF